MAVPDDPAAVLEHFINDVANLPAEIAHLYEEMEAKEQLIAECKATIASRDASLQKFIKLNGCIPTNPKEELYEKVIMESYAKAEVLMRERQKLAEKAEHLLNRHVKKLDTYYRNMQNEGSVTLDPNLPSLLRDSPNYTGGADSSLSTGVNTPLNQLSGNTSGGAINAAHQAIMSRIAATASARGNSPAVATTPQAHPVGGQPAQAVAAVNRSVRELSVSSDTKRRRPHGSLGALPPPSSNLARQSSLGPGTPKVNTPGSRQGSAGPRPAKKGVIRKVPPGQQLRKKMHSGGIRAGNMSQKKARTKVPGVNRASPSTTADDESVLSGEQTDDENASAGGPDEHGAEEMEADDEDTTKYCICHKVSHGDMVACDNDTCPYQWFHWGCVGITEEPAGEWYCPSCSETMGPKDKKKTKKK
ncbi:hypothetical protein EJ05DRAFT_502822 [Pseudovirgaria hyperparasitica]|uniref:Chromatin modification-related protein n=1 Tax=Pseudovirgaria hyperparasitica TaxID=470096 RepID=A0A6A6W041_9PEZI|nr:uncharacterized protein EJ05DRAFT_502822 [Pseudovirgaria hyperparasitica]KAF2755354.1 hypothetical protein EJ05DRAFT_502822 [Pseudovirgaria hyperparasitica]